MAEAVLGTAICDHSIRIGRPITGFRVWGLGFKVFFRGFMGWGGLRCSFRKLPLGSNADKGPQRFLVGVRHEARRASRREIENYQGLGYY